MFELSSFIKDNPENLIFYWLLGIMCYLFDYRIIYYLERILFASSLGA